MQSNLTSNASISASILSTTQSPAQRNLSRALLAASSQIFTLNNGYRGSHGVIVLLMFGNATDSASDIHYASSLLRQNNITILLVSPFSLDATKISSLVANPQNEFSFVLTDLASPPTLTLQAIEQAAVCNRTYCDASSALDLTFIIDSSSNFNSTEFTTVLEYVANVISGINIGMANTRFDLSSY